MRNRELYIAFIISRASKLYFTDVSWLTHKKYYYYCNIFMFFIISAFAHVSSSSLSLYGGWLTINFTTPIPQFDNVRLSSTFLQPARVRTQLGDIDLDLANSTVHSTSATSVKIEFDYAGFEYLYLTQSLNAHFYWTTASLQYSGDTSIVLSIYCLMTWWTLISLLIISRQSHSS